VSTALSQVYLVRHGETAWSLSGRHTGRTDIPLTEKGERDARALSARLHERPFVKVMSSPLLRARQTCELAGFASTAEPNADLMEWDYGEYEGARTAEIRVSRPGWRLLEDGCPGGENAADVAARAERVIALIRALDGDVLIFAHRDIQRVIAARWVSLPTLEARRLYMEPASVSVLGYDHAIDEPILRALNT
jgi:broad specificity phosphatase PhoE